jgi:hypothetical protein
MQLIVHPTPIINFGQRATVSITDFSENTAQAPGAVSPAPLGDEAITAAFYFPDQFLHLSI